MTGRWRRAFLPASACLLMILAVLQAEAQQMASGVLVIDPERLFEQSEYGRRILRETEQAAGELAGENRRIEADLIAEERDLTERRETLSVEEFRALADAFDAKVDRIRQQQDAKAREVQRLRETSQQQFFGRIAPVLGQLVRDRNAAVVLDRRSVFLSVEGIDVTDAAIRVIDETLGDGSDGQ